MKPIGSVKIKGKVTMLDLYVINRKDQTVTIGVANTPKTTKELRCDEHGEYVRHGCNKYYLSEFEGSN